VTNFLQHYCVGKGGFGKVLTFYMVILGLEGRI